MSLIICQQTKFRWDMTASVCKNKCTPYWNSSSLFDFDGIAVLRAILNQVPKFCQNQVTCGGVMTSYTISRWRLRSLHTGTTSSFIFSWWCHSLPKVNVYQQTKFHQHILIHGWDITTSGLEKQLSDVLKFYFQFRFDHSTVLSLSLCIRLPNFSKMYCIDACMETFASRHLTQRLCADTVGPEWSMLIETTHATRRPLWKYF